MLKANGDWMPLGNADEQKPAKEGTVEAWARSAENPVGGLVRSEERPEGSFCHLYSSDNGESRQGRGRTQPQEQPDEVKVGLFLLWGKKCSVHLPQADLFQLLMFR